MVPLIQRYLSFSKCHVLFLLVCTLVMASEAAATAQKTNSKDPRSQEDDEADAPSASPHNNPKPRIGKGLSISTKSSMAQRAVTAPIRNEGSSPVDRGSKSYRMQEYSLKSRADYLSLNANQQSSFEQLLRLEKERQKQMIKDSSSTKPPPRISPLFLSVVASSFLFAFSAFLWDPSSAQSLWKSVIGKKLGTALAVAWLPWCWYAPSKFALMDMLLLIQFVRQPAVLPYYLQKEVLPILWKTFHTMLLTEVWTRVWKWVFAHGEQVRQAVLARYDYDHNQSEREHIVIWPTSEDEPPSWLVQLHVALVGSVRKGIKSAFKTSIQETVTSAFAVWKTALEEQIMVAVEWNNNP